MGNLHHMTSWASSVRMTRRRWLQSGVAALAVGGTWNASRRVDSGADRGTTLEGPPVAPPSGKAFRVGTFNIHGCKGQDGCRDVDRVAGYLKSCDLIGLQEVHGGLFYETGSQAGQLGQRIDCPWLFAPSVRRWHSFDFGNAMLSRLPVISWQRIPLPRITGNTHHNLLLVQLEHHGRPFQTIIAHLHRKDEAERVRHLREALFLFNSLSGPALLIGDLNSRRSDPQLKRLLGDGKVQDALAGAYLGHEATNIDWILMRGFHAVDAGFEVNQASDHPFLWADLEIV